MIAEENQQKSADDWVADAQGCLRRGEIAEALQCCNEALQLDERSQSAHSALARAMMPGMGYKGILSRIHQELRPDTYVEVGVCEGHSLALARKQTRAVGIDPLPRISQEIVADYNVFEMGSDAFFKDNDLLGALGKKRLNLAFIDGLHLFEQVLRDFINIEKYANDQTVILIHDCFPPTEISARRKRVTTFWAGDVWKIIPCLKEARPDLQINVIPTAPSGLGVVSNLDSASRVLEQNIETLTEKYMDLPFSSLEKNRAQTLNVVENTWETIRPLVIL